MTANKEGLDTLKGLWKGERRVSTGELTFAGLTKLKPFRDGKQLTNSARSTFLSCRRKYQFSYVYGLAPRKPVIPFLVGGLFHDELDRMYGDGEFDEAAARKRIGKACEAAANAPGLDPQESDKIWTQQAIAFGAVKAYAERYLGQDLKRWEIVEPESAFKVDMPGGWEYRGKVDLIVLDRKTKRHLLVEHKTAGKIDAGYVAKLPLDNQILGYAWAKSRGKAGLKLDGVTYNVVKKPGIRLKQNETLNAFYKRIQAEYANDPGNYFYRETLEFGKGDLARFEQELMRFLGEMDQAAKTGYYYQNTGHCTALGPCPYMALCTKGVSKDTLMLYRVKDRPHEELPKDED